MHQIQAFLLQKHLGKGFVVMDAVPGAGSNGRRAGGCLYVNVHTTPFPEHSQLLLHSLISSAADASFPTRSPLSLLAPHQPCLAEPFFTFSTLSLTGPHPALTQRSFLGQRVEICVIELGPTSPCS